MCDHMYTLQCRVYMWSLRKLFKAQIEPKTGPYHISVHSVYLKPKSKDCDVWYDHNCWGKCLSDQFTPRRSLLLSQAGSQVAPIQAYASNLNRIPQWLHPRITSDIYAVHTIEWYVAHVVVHLKLFVSPCKPLSAGLSNAIERGGQT